MLTATLTSKGQLTLPKPIRDLFHLGMGSTVVFTIHKEEAVLRPLSKNVDELFGCLKREKQPAIDIQTMNEGIRRRAKKVFQA